ncbi:uncharacterized protein LOC131649885 [Vicia villosa]|uniref:uncharacterized protein LOC131649885 n=1 Tax=Vicia villosa TaxID=3911 RepID=UPI00273C4E48|nr:uncharacterized protein LOC131649885 [Vicia villosa]
MESFSDIVAADLLELMTIIQHVQPKVGSPDSFVWWRHPNGFSVKASYEGLIASINHTTTLPTNVLDSLRSLWASKLPSKSLIFGWRILLDRLPTKTNLFRRGILGENVSLLCPFCLLEEENSDHIFSSCLVSVRWWNQTCDWLRLKVSFPSNTVVEKLSFFEKLCKSSFRFCPGWLFGLAVCCAIWKCRNVIIFEGGDLSRIDGLGLIKHMSWEWFLFSCKLDCDVLWSDWFVSPTLIG